MNGPMLASTLEITKELVRFPSVSHVSNEQISQRVTDLLAGLGFEIEWHSYLDEHNQKKVSLVGKRGPGVGGVCYLAHTDVVPADDWSLDWCGPFEPTERDGRLYGRGTCDMKGSLAAAIVAAQNLPASLQTKPIYFVVTSDEEVGMFGAKTVNSQSKFFQEMVESGTVGIVGEPTLLSVVHAHKGGQRLLVRARGRSAHTSTNDGVNANYQLIPALNDLLAIRTVSESDARFQNQMFSPPTLSWNMTITNEPEAVNVTPSLAQVNIFLRLMPDVDHSSLVRSIKDLCEKHRLEFEEKDSVAPWRVEPQADWIQAMLGIVKQDASKSVCFATDAGVLQRLANLLICGPGNIEQAHRSDEWISFEQLDRGTSAYLEAFQFWAG